MEQQLKTGTTTVGLVTKEGVVLAADRRGTAGNMIVNKNVDKVFKIADNMAITIAGSVSDIQLITKLIKAELRLKKLKVHRETTVKEAANLVAGIVYRSIRQPSMIPSISHFLLGGYDSSGYHLYDIFPDGSVTEHEDYVASGSGSVFALGVLESQYAEDMGIEDGKKLLATAINTALQRDSASGNGITLYTITKEGVQKEISKEVSVDVRI